MSTSPEGIYEKGVIDPGFPVKNSTKPFWLTEPHKYSKLRSPWLDEADIVIIGSGMTAVSLCRTLYSKYAELQKPAPQIVIVEARDLCSGATGRNGGHTKAMSPGIWFERKRQFGVEEAVKIMEFEHGHLNEMAACIKENNLQCDLNLVEGLDIYHDKKILNNAVEALEDMRKHAPNLAARYKVYTTKEDLSARRIGHAIGAIGMPAATIWPYKMVTGLLEKYVDNSNLHIQTNTVVTRIDEHPNQTCATVKTSRGDIRASKVIHATNAFMSHLVPQIRPFVSPVRANVQRQVPDPISTSSKTAKTVPRAEQSFWLRYGEHDYDYMIQRPDASYILGRANTGRRATSDDSETDLAPQMHLRGATPLIFDFKTPKLTVSHAWSGAVAFTQDGSPFVGRLPGAKHQWVCGAYQGIGMVRAFRSAQMLVCLLEGEGVPREFPRSQLLDEKRLRGLERVLQGSKL